MWCEGTVFINGIIKQIKAVVVLYIVVLYLFYSRSSMLFHFSSNKTLSNMDVCIYGR
jgi:hypothetical protein